MLLAYLNRLKIKMAAVISCASKMRALKAEVQTYRHTFQSTPALDRGFEGFRGSRRCDR